MTFRFLVVDGYPQTSRRALATVEAPEAGALFTTLLKQKVVDCTVDTLFPADREDALPRGSGLDQYHGVVWTGSDQNVYDPIPEVTRQIDLCRHLFRMGIPQYGSCWGAQIAVVAAGGECRKNPRGMEFGIARKIRLTRSGVDHPMFAGKRPLFDSFASHLDEIHLLPSGGTLLASNRMSAVQAVSIKYKRGLYWGVQYHPEFDLRLIAQFARLRAPHHIERGFFKDHQDAIDYATDLETLFLEPEANPHLAWRYAFDDDLLNPVNCQREIDNWLEFVTGG